MAAAHGRPVPEDGYHGGYIVDLAAAIVIAKPDIVALPDDEQLVAFRRRPTPCSSSSRSKCSGPLFRTHFDVPYSERSLYESGAVERGLKKLIEQGHVYELDGAM